jgi:hypothetical protein
MRKCFKKIKKEEVVPCASIILFILFLIVILTVIVGGNAAMWVLTMGACLMGGIFKFLKGSFEAFKAWWLSLHKLVHFGLIFFEIMGLTFAIIFWGSGLKMKFFDKNGKEIIL